MNTSDGTRRHVWRHGWLRNRRAVVVDADGLTIERWVGAPLRLSWADVTSIRWRGPHRLVVSAGLRDYVFDSAVAGLFGLGEQLAAATTRRTGEPRDPMADDDIEHWLGGFSSAAVEVRQTKLAPARWPTLVVAAILLVVAALVKPAPDNIVGCWVGGICCIVAQLLCWRDSKRRRPTLERWLVVADRCGVQISRQDGTRESFAWSEVETVQSGTLVHEVWLSDGRVTTLPASPELVPVLYALRMALAQRRGLKVEAPPVPDSALSPAGPPSAAARRGLSRTRLPARRKAPEEVRRTGKQLVARLYVIAMAMGLVIVAISVVHSRPLALLVLAGWLVAGMAAAIAARRQAITWLHEQGHWATILGNRVIVGDERGATRIIDLRDVVRVTHANGAYQVELSGGQQADMPDGQGVGEAANLLRAVAEGRWRQSLAPDDATEQQSVDA